MKQSPLSTCASPVWVGPISVLVILLAGLCSTPAAPPPTQTFYVEQFPGLVFGLRHNVNQKGVSLPFKTPPFLNAKVAYVQGGDYGGSSGEGFTWFAVRGDPSGQPIGDGKHRTWAEPEPNITIALRHTLNDRNGINLFGVQPSHHSARVLRRLVRMDGGDDRAPNHEGYFWYENLTGGSFAVAPHQPDLPKGTVLGLRHTIHQKFITVDHKRLSAENVPVWYKHLSYNILWAEKFYLNHKHLSSAADYLTSTNNRFIPEGFTLMRGGDLGLEENEGFIWFEKIKGPEPFELLD